MAKKKELTVKESRAQALAEIKKMKWDKPINARELQDRMAQVLMFQVKEGWVRSVFKHLAEYNEWELPKKTRTRTPQGWRLELVKCAQEGLEDIDEVITRVSDHVKTKEKAEEYVKEFYMYFQVCVKGL